MVCPELPSQTASGMMLTTACTSLALLRLFSASGALVDCYGSACCCTGTASLTRMLRGPGPRTVEATVRPGPLLKNVRACARACLCVRAFSGRACSRGETWEGEAMGMGGVMREGRGGKGTRGGAETKRSQHMPCCEIATPAQPNRFAKFQRGRDCTFLLWLSTAK